MPVKDKQISRSVNIQEGVPSSVLSFYKDFINFRKTNVTLQEGNQYFIDNDEDLLIFTREFQGVITLCIFNLGEVSFMLKTNFNFDKDNVLSLNIHLREDSIEIEKNGLIIMNVEEDHRSISSRIDFRKLV